jgi:hypothetical protein
LSNGIYNIGIAEAFMDWHLTYRSESEMISIADKIDPMEIKKKKIIGIFLEASFI